VQKWLVEDIPSTRKFGGYWPTRRFSIYFRPQRVSCNT